MVFVNMRQIRLIVLIQVFFQVFGNCQMYNGQDTLYGNEWLEVDQKYLKIKIWEDGIYRIPMTLLSNAGIPNSISGNQFQLFLFGEEQPIFTSTEDDFSPNDFIEFYGKKNRDELDKFLFEDAETEALNPEYSLVTDTIIYFLTWTASGNHFRYKNFSSNILSTEPFDTICQSLIREVNTANYNQQFESGTVLSSYDYSEGYGSRFLSQHTHQLDLNGEVVSNHRVRLKIRIIPNGIVDDRTLSIKLNGEEILKDTSITPLMIMDKEIEFDSELLEKGGEVLIEGLGGSLDRYSYSIIELNFLKKFDAQNDSVFSFVLPKAIDSRFVKIENFEFEEMPILVSLENDWRILADTTNGEVRFEIPPGDSSQYILIDPIKSNKIIDLDEMSFPIEISNEDYLIISHPYLINDPEQPIQKYAEYRSSPEGGSHLIKIINIETLYDYFSYGIYGHPLSVRNFAHLLVKSGKEPQVILLGKGLESHRIRQAGAEIFQQNLIPVFGIPGSDNLLFSSNSSDIPVLDYGRIAASDASDVFIYLNKIKTYEAGLRLPRTAENWGWRKQFVHLVGGDLSEQIAFEFLLNPLKIAAEIGPIKGEVTTFKKISSDPLQTSVSDETINKINEGVFIKTFFGHGGVTITDFGLDDANLFEVNEKFPIIFSLGCQTGNIFTLENSVSENFIISKSGGIVYFATSGNGITSNLSSFGNEWYQLLGDTISTMSLGHLNTLIRRKFDPFNSFTTKSLNQQFSFHGDPALKIRNYYGADLVIDERTITHFPKSASIQTDSIQIDFEVVNLGTAVDSQKVIVELTHTFNSEELVYRDSFQFLKSFNKIGFKIPLADSKFRGFNSIKIKIDPENLITEIPDPEAENNNEIQFSNGNDFYTFFVSEKDVLPIFPEDNAILTDSFLTITCSPTEIFSEDAIEYLIQMDSTKSFDSPFFQEKKFSQNTGLIKWDLSNLNLQSGQVYYWRTAIDSMLTNGEFNWKTRSFVYRENSSDRGWHHSHREQWQENSSENLEFDSTNQQFQFSKNVLSAVADAMILSTTNNSVTRFLLNGIRIYRGSFSHGANIATVILDPITGQRVNYATGNVFNTKTSEGRQLLMELIRDSIPAGHYVTVLSFQINPANTYEPEIWAVDSINLGINLFQLFEAQGATRIRELEALGAVPYAFAFIKNNRPLGEAIGANGEEVVTVLFDLPTLWVQGSILSEPIGPATEWGDLQWNHSNIEPSDSVSFKLLGRRHLDSIPIILEESISPDFRSLEDIDANQFPYLQLEYFVVDSLKRTPSQLNFWEVTYQGGLPDGLIRINDLNSDTLQQGEKLEIRYAIENGSFYNDLDSTKIEFSIVDEQNQTFQIIDSVEIVDGGLALEKKLEIDTKDLTGEYQININLNPEKQPDEFTFANNLGVLSFFTTTDTRNPLLDVTFDGEHIMNGDLISAEPYILISLKDENEFFLLNDTAAFEITLQYPDGNQEVLNFSDPKVVFIPAESSTNNLAKVEFRPILQQDGEYELRINANDRSGNESGQLDYQIKFEVINETQISNLVPYPNPFSTSTRFVYTLTGKEQLDDIVIQILTVSGRVVREISSTEFGSLKIGTHVSDFSWDGRDEYGDLLANGVYLYRVKNNRRTGQTIKHFETSADSFFKKGFGKMVILR